jgi:hypothetical protein
MPWMEAGARVQRAIFFSAMDGPAPADGSNRALYSSATFRFRRATRMHESTAIYKSNRGVGVHDPIGIMDVNRRNPPNPRLFIVLMLEL